VLLILLVILILLSLGSLPTWPHSRIWGYYPSGGLGLVVIILVVLLLLGRLRAGSRSSGRPNNKFFSRRPSPQKKVLKFSPLSVDRVVRVIATRKDPACPML
jgi:hypothetical protein